MKVKRLIENIGLPGYGSEGSAGLDLRSSGRFKKLPVDGAIGEEISEDNYSLKPSEHILVLTGYSVEIPSGHYGHIKARSGLTVKYGLQVGAGVIDSDYRNEVGVVLINLGNVPYIIKKNERIAQMIIKPYSKVDVNLVKELDDNDRGGGFGSTGSS